MKKKHETCGMLRYSVLIDVLLPLASDEFQNGFPYSVISAIDKAQSTTQVLIPGHK